jgi:hypothetical protein
MPPQVEQAIAKAKEEHRIPEAGTGDRGSGTGKQKAAAATGGYPGGQD